MSTTSFLLKPMVCLAMVCVVSITSAESITTVQMLDRNGGTVPGMSHVTYSSVALPSEACFYSSNEVKVSMNDKEWVFLDPAPVYKSTDSSADWTVTFSEPVSVASLVILIYDLEYTSASIVFNGSGNAETSDLMLDVLPIFDNRPLLGYTWNASDGILSPTGSDPNADGNGTALLFGTGDATVSSIHVSGGSRFDYVDWGIGAIVVPEPTTLSLFTVGGLMLLVLSRRRRTQ